MEISLIVALVSGVNLVAVCGMFILFLRELGKRGDGRNRNMENGNLESLNNKILDKFSKLEARLNEFPRASNESESRTHEINKPVDRINLAIEKLNRGIAPDTVREELGYSRSEMGILLASAKLGRIKIKQN